MKRKTKIILTVVLAICAISLFSAVRSSGIVAAVLGILSVAGIGFLWKKPAKQSQSTSAVESRGTRGSGSAPLAQVFGKSPELISIARFQRVVFDSFVVVDLETTGLDKTNDTIVEIGAVKVEKGVITDRFSELINPGIPIPSQASAVNNITDKMVKHSPHLSEVLPRFLTFTGDNILVAHNAGFDSAFIFNACRKLHLESPSLYFDTMRLTVYWPNLPNRKLATFLTAAGIQNDNAHRALSDAEATAKLVMKSFEKIA